MKLQAQDLCVQIRSKPAFAMILHVTKRHIQQVIPQRSLMFKHKTPIATQCSVSDEHGQPMSAFCAEWVSSGLSKKHMHLQVSAADFLDMVLSIQIKIAISRTCQETYGAEGSINPV